MTRSLLIDPDTVRVRLAHRYELSQRRWLRGDGVWPISIPLGLPSESEARRHLSAVQDWQARWKAWRGEGALEWVERRWPILGTQRLPERLLLHRPEQVAHWAGDAGRWRRVEHRMAAFTSRWPVLGDILAGRFDVLADSSDAEFERVTAMLSWLETNRASGLYLRQLPVEGVDTKWLEARKSILLPLLCALRNIDPRGADIYTVGGIRKEPVAIRLRILDPELRCRVGGLADITTPVDEMARLSLPFQWLYVVENLQTGLAFGDLPGAAVIMGLGYSVDLLGQLPWARTLPCRYWGDLDTHGFAILNRLRHYLPHAESILMDEATLLEHRQLWGTEGKPSTSQELPLLTLPERAVFRGLSDHRWGPRVRLEQERVPWAYAWPRLLAAHA